MLGETENCGKALTRAIGGALTFFGVDLLGESGLSERRARRRMRSFVDLVASDGLRFGAAPAMLRKAGFTGADALTPRMGFPAEELAHKDGSTTATIVMCDARPALNVQFSPAGWYRLEQDFERMFAAALGAPLQRLEQCEPRRRIYQAKIAGRRIRIEFACGGQHGERRISLFARALTVEGRAAIPRPRRGPAPRDALAARNSWAA